MIKLKNISTYTKKVIFLIFFLSLVSIFIISCASKSEESSSVSNVAHRGGAEIAPENSLAAFSKALEYDIDMIELDLHLSKDGIIMVFHDPSLERLTGEEGFISDYTAEELSQFDCASTYKKGKHDFGFQKIPTLDEVITLIEEQSATPIKYQIEIKVQEDDSRYIEIEEKLVQLLEKHSIQERTIVISFNFPTLKKLNLLSPDLQLGALVSKGFFSAFPSTSSEKIAKYIKNLDVEYVGINYKYLSQELYDEFRKNDLGVGVWTVNDKIRMKKFITMGVDFITTNRPDLLSKQLSN